MLGQQAESDTDIGLSDSSEPESEGGTSDYSLSDSDLDFDGHAFAYHDNKSLDNCIQLHCRLGHMHPDKMIEMHKQGIDMGLKVTLKQLTEFKDHWCAVVPYRGRMVRADPLRGAFVLTAPELRELVARSHAFRVERRPREEAPSEPPE